MSPFASAFFLIGVIASASDGDADGGEPGRGMTACGPRALYLLSLLVTGRAPGLDRDAGRPSHSLLELREAARGWGLPLRGARLDLGSERLRSPALVHLSQPVPGHFIVIRPVGWSGKLV